MKSRRRYNWHKGTWQPFESVRLACERSAERLKEQEGAVMVTSDSHWPEIKMTVTGGLHPLFDQKAVYQELADSIERRIKQSKPSSVSDDLRVELGFLRDLNDNLRQLVQEMREHTEQAKASLEKAG